LGIQHPFDECRCAAALLDVRGVPGEQQASLNDYLAAERTLLAWIRTSLALMGFGFVVARFGLFLRELQHVRGEIPLGRSGASLWFGVVLIISGVVVIVSSGLHHIRLVRALRRGKVEQPHTVTLAVTTALLLALVGIGMAVYLFRFDISVRGSP
jgi:inner membrane protein YidH